MSPVDATEHNRAYYDQLAAGQRGYWEHMPAPALRVRRLIETIRRGADPRDIADFGCGGGQLLQRLHDAFPDAALTGVDLAEAQIRENAEQHPWAAWTAGDLCDRLQLDHPVDVIVCSEVIEHLDTPELLLANALANLRPLGRLLLSTQSGRIGVTEQHVGHVRHWARDEMADLLAAAGFTDVRVWNEGYPFHDLSKFMANLRPQATIRAFGERSYGPGQLFVCQVLRLLFRLNSKRRGAQLFACAARPR